MTTYVEHHLPKTFRYLHEPIQRADIEGWFSGRSVLTQHLADRLMFSNGGAFLVTGYRGVGKTTFVHRTLGLIDSQAARYSETTGAFELVDVWLNLARPMERRAFKAANGPARSEGRSRSYSF